MSLNLYSTSRFEKQLLALEKSDKRGALAIRQVKEIVANLMKNEALALKTKKTKKGELRLKNCRKYDLGSGYRLICLKQDDFLFLLYVGSHDECDRWLNRQRGGSFPVRVEGALPVGGEKENSESLPRRQVLEPEDDEYEEQLLRKLDDRMLRLVFSGICEK